MSISVQNLTKRFASFTALSDIDLQVRSGELLALLGPSGSGKTTLLRILAGLETPDSGQVLLEGVDVTHDPVRERRMGFVFQHYALFRHLSIFENIAFGLRVQPKAQRPPETEIRRRVLELLDLIQLSWVADRFPHELSGGQRQRVALARALAVQPRVLLLDEPFGALDAKVRQELRSWLRRLHDEIHLTSVFVTHDQEEALEVSDRVVILEQGRIAQIGTPVEVYHGASSPFVYEFLGPANRFGADLLSPVLAAAEQVQAPWNYSPRPGDQAYVRPQDFVVGKVQPGSLTARLSGVRPLGQQVWLYMDLPGHTAQVRAQLPWREWLALGAEPGSELGLRPRQVQVFPAPSGSAAWQGEGGYI